MDQELLNNWRQSRPNNGFGIIEIVIAMSIIGGVLFALISVFILSKDSIEFAREKLQASFLAEEGIEVLKFERDLSWTSNIDPLDPDTKYYLLFSTSTSLWSVTTTPPPKTDGLFERSFYMQRVSRDSSSNIEAIYNSANVDPGTRKIIMTVEWTYKNSNNSVVIEAYLTNLFSN